MLHIWIVKRSKPQMKDLQNIITPNYASCWKELGIQLDIPVETLRCIEKAYPTDLFRCCNDMLIHWHQYDAEGSWNKVINAIESPAIAMDHGVVSFPSKAVLNLVHRLKLMSINNRYKVEDDKWPLSSPKHYTNLTFILHKHRHSSKREILAIATLQKSGDFDLHKIVNHESSTQYLHESKCTKCISDIFAKIDGTNKSPYTILIEGVTGIGKTVLSKEIVFQWSNGRLLPNITLMFLVYLHDPESHKITSLNSFVNYVSYHEVAKDILQYITDNKGNNLMIIFDGYNDFSKNFSKDSFLHKIITRNIVEIPFCNVVITSRPNATASLHDKVDLRVEILGFTNEDRIAYITDALKHDDNKIEKVMKYLNNNPAVNAYCYIPLNMTIFLSVFQNDDDIAELPNTQTDINEKFICTTISRYIRKLKGVKLNFATFSEVQGMPYGTILKEISRLAFKALEKDKIVFTPAELQETCPCLTSQSENWNGLGLLKAVQVFTMENNSRNVSFNFLHFTIQEILAAYHITLMSKADQLKCMKQTFWDNRYCNTWIMYVGLTKNQQSVAFKHFLSGNRLLLHTRFLNWWNNGTYCRMKRSFVNDKIKCLHLFQCFSEAENYSLCQYVGQLLQENEIDLSGQSLSAINVLTISIFLTRSTTRYWKILDLSKCFIGDDGIRQLHNSFKSNNRGEVFIHTLNLSYDNLSQFSLKFIAGLILEWNVKNLDISFNDICWYSLNEEMVLQIMQLEIHNISIECTINENVTLFLKLSELEYLSISFNSIPARAVNRITAISQAKDNTKSVDINVTGPEKTGLICTKYTYS